VTGFADFAARLRQSRFLRFALVGTAGFVVNTVAFWVVHHLMGLNNYWSWYPAFFVAVTFTWWGNRTLTFHENAARFSLFREWGKFVAASGFGAVANLALFTGLIRFAPPPVNNWFLALAAGTLLGLAFNFTLSKRFVFRGSSHSA
jgi:putative flippase GtrA